LYDKTDDVSAYYLEKKIHELDPKYFERIESFLVELKTYNEKLNNCGKDYKKIDTTLIILVEQKFPSVYDMFIQTWNRAIEMSNGTVKPTFEEFCKGLICEQDRLISSGQLVIGKAHLAHTKKNPYKGSHKNTKSHDASTSNQTSNDAPVDASKKKVWKPCKHCGKTNHAEKNCFKRQNELEKEKKKASKEQQVALSAYFVQPGNSSSYVEWIMDSGASNHMTGTASLFTSYDNNKHTTQKVSISDGKQLSVVGSGNIQVPNGVLEDVFHVEGMPINLLSVYHACQKGYKFEAWPDRYVLKDIKNNFKIVSSGLVDHEAGLFKFIGFTSPNKQPFYSYVAHVDEQSKLWHERLGHLNYGKMQLFSKMVHGLPTVSSTKGVCEGCVLGKHHRENFDKDKAWYVPKKSCS
jgi:hypothetical protein